MKFLETIRNKIAIKSKVAVQIDRRLPPKGAVRMVFATPFGPIFENESGVLLPVSTRQHIFRDLAPLFYIKNVQEIFLSARANYTGNYFITGIATINGKRFPFKAIVDFEAVVLDIVRVTGANISLKNPSVAVEYGGWRLHLKMPSITGGEWELEAAKLLPPPSLVSYGSLISARILTLGLTRIATLVVGEPGAGKTTLLNSILIEELKLFPMLRTVILEIVPELYVPQKFRKMVSRHIARNGDLGETLRNALRYSRPDVLFVGEIRARDIDFIEAGRSGTPTLSTIHSPNAITALKAIAMHARTRLGPTVNTADIANYIKGFIEVRKMNRGNEIKRGIIVGVALSDERKLRYIYYRGRVCPDREFLDILSAYDTIVGVSPNELYENIKQNLGASNMGSVKLPKVYL